MMENTKLRRADFITSIILILFGLWMLITTVTTFPMKDSWGGVQNVWYVSPALFPLFTSLAIILLGIVLLLNAIKAGGAKTFFEETSRITWRLSENMLRFLAIVLVICTYVYLNIPRIDFFLSSMFCLFVFIAMYYLEHGNLLKKFTLFYFVGSLVFAIIFVIGLDKPLNKIFSYSMDILMFLFYLFYVRYVWGQIREQQELKKKFYITLIVSIVVPLFLCPVFKYFLLVPLPTEGGVIELMNIVRYSLR